jgi:hypothetical protein
MGTRSAGEYPFFEDALRVSRLLQAAYSNRVRVVRGPLHIIRLNVGVAPILTPLLQVLPVLGLHSRLRLYPQVSI